MRIIAGAITFVFGALVIAAGSTLLFLVGDRGNVARPSEKRRDAAWAVVRGIVGLGGGWVVWLATGQSLWLLIPGIVWPISLYLIVSGITDLVLLYTRDRELLRQEEAALRRDQPIMELAREGKKSHALMRKAGMTDEEIDSWASRRAEQTLGKMEEALSEPGRSAEARAPQESDTNRPDSGWRSSSQIHDLTIEHPSEEFFACWQAAGSHLNGLAEYPAMGWLKVDLVPPFLEHLSFRFGNQLFFIRVVDSDGRVDGPGSTDGLLAIADGCKGRPCIMPMRRHKDGWGPPDRPGWGLIDARTGEVIDPPSVVSDERIEMTDWEVQDFAVQVVRDALKKSGRRVLSSQGNPSVDPSIWFVQNGERAWVVVRAVRFPQLVADVPHNWRQIAKGCARLSEVGYFASVAAAGGEEGREQTPDIRLLRGHPLYARYAGLGTPTADEIDAAEEEFIGRGRIASRHRGPLSGGRPTTN